MGAYSKNYDNCTVKILVFSYTRQGGISNGEIINMRIAFKPTATISVSVVPPQFCFANMFIVTVEICQC